MKAALAAVPNATSLAKSASLPDSWVERIFQKMEDRYGDMWANRYGAFPRDRVMRTWGEDLADLSSSELATGMTACKSAKFPPTLPEFRELCRPPIDFESAYIEACNQIVLRQQGRDQWSHPAIYWAAQSVGQYDLRNSTWGSIKARWTKALQTTMNGGCDPVPAFAVALPAPGETSVSPEEAARRVAEMMSKLSSKVVRAE